MADAFLSDTIGLVSRLIFVQMRNLIRASLIGLAISLVSVGLSDPSPVMAEQHVHISIEGKGDILITLYPDRAPKTCARIIDLFQKGFYDGQRFHKVVKSPKPFLVQVGDPNSRVKEMRDPSLGSYKSGAQIPYENSGLKHVRGAVGLSHLEGSRDSGDSQFYIMLDSYSFLDGQYTVFGVVQQGLDVLDKIELGDKITRISFQN